MNICYPPPTQVSSNLPIIQKATEAYKLWHAFHNSFPRLSKYSLGGRIDTLFADMMEQLFLARYATGARKLAHLNEAGARLDILKFFIQIAWEIKALEHKKFAALSPSLNEIGKMIGGWQKQLQIKQPPSK